MPSPDRTVQLIRTELERHFGSNRMRRFQFEDLFLKRPIIESDMDAATPSQATQRIYSAGNKDLKSSGTNMTSALGTFSSGGGVTLTTAGASADQALLSPATVNSGGTFITAIGGTTGAAGTSPWLTANKPYMRAEISLSSIASVRFVFGLKLTTTPTLATDDDQAFISFDTGSSVSATAWRYVASVGGVDSDVAAPAGIPAVAAATNYFLEIKVDENRYANFFVNEVMMGSLGPLTTPMALIPVIGIQALTGAAKAFSIRNLRLSRTY